MRIFLNYRREDAADAAGRLFDGLAAHFGNDQVFMDIDAIEPGVDFEEVVNQAVGRCDVLIAVIGRQWLTAMDTRGRRRLDNPDDYVRMELEAALERNVRVIPVLVQGVDMPDSDELPDALKKLARRNAVEISTTRWRYDMGRLTAALAGIADAGRQRQQRAETVQHQPVVTEAPDRERPHYQPQQPQPQQPPPRQPLPPPRSARARDSLPLILVGIIALAGIAVGALAAAGIFSHSGSTRTTIIRNSSTPKKATPNTPPPGAIGSCGGNLWVGANTSCPFAQNVQRAYDASSGGTTDVSAHSPDTGLTYTMRCTGSSPHVCTGGKAASVYFTGGP